MQARGYLRLALIGLLALTFAMPSIASAHSAHLSRATLHRAVGRFAQDFEKSNGATDYKVGPCGHRSCIYYVYGADSDAYWTWKGRAFARRSDAHHVKVWDPVFSGPPFVTRL